VRVGRAGRADAQAWFRHGSGMVQAGLLGKIHVLIMDGWKIGKNKVGYVRFLLVGILTLAVACT
jgi:hypothetical protein